MIKLSEKEKQAKNLFTYAVILLLAVVIIIIIAAMADDHEQKYRNEINSSKETATTVQNEIIELKDELYRLQQENDELKKQAEESAKYRAQIESMNQVWVNLSTGRYDEAQTAFKSIDPSGFDDTLSSYYAALSKLMSKISK